jgi:hypothetical protein
MKVEDLFLKAIFLLHLDVAEVILKAVNSNNPEIRYLEPIPKIDRNIARWFLIISDNV